MVTAATLCAALDDILHLYNKADIYVTKIQADNEFKSIFRELDEIWEVDFNFSLPQEHVPDIEHENCVLQREIQHWFVSSSVKNVAKVDDSLFGPACDEKQKIFSKEKMN